MANSKIPNLTLSDTLNTQRLKFNQLLDSVGDISALTTTAGPLTDAINELDSELGTISAAAMGTTANTISGAIAELDGRLDSINDTELLSPRMSLSDAAATNTIAGKLEVSDSSDFASNVSVQGNLAVGGNTTMSGTLTVDGQVTFKAGSDNNISLGDAATDTITLTGEVNSNVVPDSDDTYDLGSASKEWRHVYVDGTVNADNVAADSATIGTLTVTGNTTFNNTITVQDSAYVTGNLDVGGNLDVAGNITIDGDTTLSNTITVQDSAYITGDLVLGSNLKTPSSFTLGAAATSISIGSYNTGTTTIQHDLVVDSNLTVHGLADLDSTSITGNLIMNTNKFTVDHLGNTVIAGTLDVNDVITLDSAVIANLEVTGLTTLSGDTTLENALTVQDSAYITGNTDIGGNLTVGGGFTVSGTFTTTGTTRNAAAYVIVNDQVPVSNSNRSGLAIDRPSNDSAVMQWNEEFDYWEAGTTTNIRQLARQDDSAAFTNLYAGGTLTVTGNTTLNNPTSVNSTLTVTGDTTLQNALTVQDSAYITGNLQLGGDAVVEGNLTVRGTTTTVNSTTVEIGDNIIVLNDSLNGSGIANVVDAGIEIERGTSTNIQLLWDESEDYWVAANDGSNTLSRIATAAWLDATAPISFNSSTGNISHDNTTRTNVSTSETLLSAGSFDVVDSIQSNSKGHITQVATRTITLPTSDNYVSWTLSGDGGSSQTINSGDTVDIAGGTYITTTAGATDTLTVNHDNTSRSDATTTATPNYGETFDVIDSIQTNATGHVTSVRVKTVTIPASDDTNQLTVWYIEDSDGTEKTMDHNKELKILGDNNHITTNFGSGTGVDISPYNLKISHTLSSATGATIGGSVTSGGSFSAVTGITFDEAGHVDSVQTTNFSVFSDTNTDTLQSVAATATDANHYITFVANTSGAQTAGIDGGLLYNPSTNTLDVVNLTDVLTVQGDDANPMVFKNDDLNFDFQASTSDTTSRPPYINLRNTDTSTVDDQTIGAINFWTDDDGGTDTNYVQLIAQTSDVTSPIEGGLFKIDVKNGASTLTAFTSDGSTTTVGADFYSYFECEQGNWFFQTDNNATSSNAGLELNLYHKSVLDDNDILADINFQGKNSTSSVTTWGTIRNVVTDVSNGTEDAKIEIRTITAGSDTLNSTFEGDDLTVQGDVNSVSDVRTKENIETVENGLDLVSQLRGVWYNKIGEEDRKVGVIAQEVEEVLPEVVHTDTEGMKAVDYGKMVGVLIEAIKELKQEIQELKSK